MIRRLAALTPLFLASTAMAQREDEQAWFQANTHVPLAPGWRVTLEQIARFGDRADGLVQSEIGALLGAKVSRNVELGFGYRWVGIHTGTGANENRLRQQVIAVFGPVTTRFRVDERFNPRGSEIGFRVRPQVRYNHRIDKDGTALFVSHESFWLPNSTSWGQRRGYERMRNLVGLALPLRRGIGADIAYLNQYRPGRSGSTGQMDHAVNLQLTVDLAQLRPPRLHD